jgi:hypothetical protein
VNGETAAKMDEANLMGETAQFMKVNGSKANTTAVVNFKHQTARFSQEHLRMANF